ncbi:MAG: type III pantothenate kinase [bacterium]
MNIVIDVGNTHVKTGIFRDDVLIEHEHYESFELTSIQYIFNRFPSIESCIISSVREKDTLLENELNKRTRFFLSLSSSVPLPVKNLYKTPETLGNDRIAGIIGGTTNFPRENLLVIDTGTAITYDIINDKNEYLGGNISPGLAMRFKALNTFTRRLPLLKKDSRFPFIGKDTNEAIIAGVQNGIIFEIEGYTRTMQEKFKSSKIILTGGDAIFFDKFIKNANFVDPFLVLKGLNKILNYNAQTN